ncbi:MAG: hypothetical protein HUU38_31570 [Anaerolineales bacterium]|nr:hypothetical protein [Anaerolineales bacterium]
MKTNTSPKPGFLRLLILALFINLLTQAIHETGHLLAYQAYGRNPTWGFIGLVQRWNTPPDHPEGWVQTSTPEGEIGWLRLDALPTEKSEIALIGAAGPLASLFFAFLGLYWAYKYKHSEGMFKYVALMLALSTSLVMGLYYLRSPFRVIGDEHDIATYFGLAKSWVEIPLGLAFITCFGLGFRWLSSWRERGVWFAACFLGSVSAGILLTVFDGWVREAVNQRIPLVQPFLGVSMPVLIVDALAVLGILGCFSTRKKRT